MVLFFAGAVCGPVFGGETLSDPMRPAAMTASQALQNGQQPQKWRLTTTITGPQRQVAVINDRVVEIGQTINGAVLLKVLPGSALLVHGGSRFHLKINGKTVKHSVRTAP